MHVVLLALGLAISVAGIALIGFGAFNAAELGNTLLIAGTIAIVGSLILIGLASAIRQLRRIAQALEMRQLPREPEGAEAAPPSSLRGALPEPRVEPEPERIEPKIGPKIEPAVAAVPEPQPAVPEAAPQAVPPVSEPEPEPVRIFKSGVIDGMAYTLYTDGSIEAELAQGTVKFASIDELRAYLAARE